MSTTEDPPCVAGTLAWCNERRAEREMDPLDQLPKGHRHDPFSCPCGKATGLLVACSRWTEAGAIDRNGKLPPAVREFVALFDAGGLPQYEETIS